MPYFKNEQARSGGATYGHEKAVALRVQDAGFTEVDKSLFPGITKSMLKKFAQTGVDTDLREVTQGLAPGSYILQPSGSQGFPDILVLDFNNVFVCVECKSGKGVAPMWNDSLPHPTTIYVFATKKTNETTVFLGRDVISIEELNCRDDFVNELKQLITKYRTIMPTFDFFKRGWVLKARQQFFQEGGGDKTNYFTHPQRSTCEKLALEFARQ
jgi:hypothetical protein